MITRIDAIESEAEQATKNVLAVRSAVSSVLHEVNPILEQKFLDLIGHFQPFASKHAADPDLEWISRELSRLLPE
jgi:hypothetical protein